jgi:hypothetical protein
MFCSTNGIRHITVPKQSTCPDPLMTSVTLLFWSSEHVLLRSLLQNSNVTDVISGAGHAHCFGTVMWRMPLVEQVMLTVSEQQCYGCHYPSHYCSETVSMSCSTNDIRHITVLKQWTCPAPLMASVTLLFWNSDAIILVLFKLFYLDMHTGVHHDLRW